MFGKIFGFCIFLLVAPSTLSQQQECGKCMSNFALCLNETSYQLCYQSTSGLVEIDGVYNCGENEYCTDSQNVCDVPDDKGIKSVCGASSLASSCGSCDGKTNGDFACMSATQFAICRSGSGNAIQPSNPLACPTGELCSEELSDRKICAPQVVLDFLNAEPTCPFVEEVTPEPPTDAPIAVITEYCKNSNQTGNYFQVANPEDCRSYVYCQRDGSSEGFLVLDMKCKTGQFYSVAQNRCITASSCPNRRA